MKTSLTILAILTTTLLIAQDPVFWVGGTPGQETSWDVARNWSNHRVPDGLTRVIIEQTNSGHHAQPVITGLVEVLSIEIYNGATLTISESGNIVIDGYDTYSIGIRTYGGIVINEGLIQLNQTEGLPERKPKSGITGSGAVLIAMD